MGLIKTLCFLLLGQTAVFGSYIGTRGLFPGTLWCGHGNVAQDATQLGIYPGTDHCCRLHDQCPHRILAFSSGHGLFNIRPHTVMWCECDSAFRHCLRSDRSEKSALVARVFFNQLSPPCFEFNGQSRSTCAQRAWYGRCLRWEDSKQAVWSSSRPVDL